MKPSHILGIFGAICILLSFILSSNINSTQQASQLSGQGGAFGPIVVKDNNTPYTIKVRNPVALNKWSNIEVDVLDKDKKVLFSFGDGMWNERGRDADGAWAESKKEFSIDVTFKKAGQYFLNIKSERNDGAGSNITVIAIQKRGSKVPFMALGIISLLIAFAFYKYEEHKGHAPVKNRSIFIGLGLVLAMLFTWALLSSTRGYGYMGYHGYHSGPSFFYFGGPRIYPQRSNRTGSVGGSTHRSGGISGGGK
jgi:hypothetical protein